MDLNSTLKGVHRFPIEDNHTMNDIYLDMINFLVYGYYGD